MIEHSRRVSLTGALLLNGLLAAAVLWASGEGEPALVYSIAGLGAILLVWQGVLWWQHFRRGRPLYTDVRIIASHYFQGFTQGSHYVYLGLYYAPVYEYVPLVLVQLVFAYLFDMLLAWSRGRTWSMGFGPFPIIGSINLFLWFKPEVFFCQLLMVAVAFLTKEFIRWNRDGRSRHIFNPSAIVLSLAGFFLIATDSLAATTGVNLVNSYEFPPSFFEFMFLFGLMVQVLFRTTQVTLGAVLALTVIFFGAESLLGAPFSHRIFHINVFLGLNLLATDPATSPGSKTGKFLFGLTWGTAIVGTYMLLRAFGEVSYYDKIFPVLLVNLLVPTFERVAARIDAKVDVLIPWAAAGAFFRSRFLHIGAYVLLFISILPNLKGPAQEAYFDYPYSPDSRPIQETEVLRANARDFCIRYPEACEPWGILDEVRNHSDFSGSLFAGRWQVQIGESWETVLNLTVQSGHAVGEFSGNRGGDSIEGDLALHETVVVGTWTELPEGLTPKLGGVFHARLRREGQEHGSGDPGLWLSQGSQGEKRFLMTFGEKRPSPRRPEPGS